MQFVSHDHPSEPTLPTISTSVAEFLEEQLAADRLSSAMRLALLRAFPSLDASSLIWPKLETALPAVVENERQFASAVIAAFARWSQEPGVLVLWDMDGTVGVRHAYNPRAALVAWDLDYPWSLSDFAPAAPLSTWGFRPAMPPLFDLLPRLFPNVRNGILSGRALAELHAELLDPLELRLMARFVDDRVYSSHVDLEPGESMGAHQRHKAVVREALRASGINVKVIDDNIVAATEEANGNGLHIARFAIDPRFSVFL